MRSERRCVECGAWHRRREAFCLDCEIDRDWCLDHEDANVRLRLDEIMARHPFGPVWASQLIAMQMTDDEVVLVCKPDSREWIDRRWQPAIADALERTVVLLTPKDARRRLDEATTTSDRDETSLPVDDDVTDDEDDATPASSDWA